MSHLRTVFLVVLLLFLTACGEGTAPSATDEGPIAVGTEPAYPPFETESADGRLEGFDIDLVRALGVSLGREIDFRPMEFKSIIPDLDSGRLDMAASGISYTDERAQRIDFSAPYVRVPMGVLLNSERAANVKTRSDLDSKDVVIAVQVGTSGETKAAEAFPNAQLRRYDREVDAANEVAAGRVHALVYDMVSVAKLNKIHPDTTRILEVDLGVEHYCLAFPKGSPLTEQANEFLAAASKPGGKLDEILARWLPRPELFRMPGPNEDKGE